MAGGSPVVGELPFSQGNIGIIVDDEELMGRNRETLQCFPHSFPGVVHIALRLYEKFVLPDRENKKMLPLAVAPLGLRRLRSQKIKHEDSRVVESVIVCLVRISQSHDERGGETLGHGRIACNVHRLYYRILLQCGMHGDKHAMPPASVLQDRNI